MQKAVPLTWICLGLRTIDAHVHVVYTWKLCILPDACKWAQHSNILRVKRVMSQLTYSNFLTSCSSPWVCWAGEFTLWEWSQWPTHNKFNQLWTFLDRLMLSWAQLLLVFQVSRKFALNMRALSYYLATLNARPWSVAIILVKWLSIKQMLWKKFCLEHTYVYFNR